MMAREIEGSVMSLMRWMVVLKDLGFRDLWNTKEEKQHCRDGCEWYSYP